MTVTAADNIFC